MKATLDQKALADALTWVARAISKQPLTPEMAGIQISASANEVTLAAYDFEVSHTANVEAVVAHAGEVLVSGRFLSSIVAALKPGEVVLDLDEGDTLMITSGRSTYRTRPLPLADFPHLPALPPMPVEVNAEVFAQLVASTKFPVDDASPIKGLRGLRIEGSGGVITLVGGRTATVTINGMDYEGPDFAVTLPVRALEDALRGLTGQARFGATPALFGIEAGGRSVTSRVFDPADFADWRQVLKINDGEVCSTVASASDVLDAVKRARLLADRGEPRMLVRITDGEMHLSAVTEAGDGAEVVECEEMVGEEQTLSVNPFYFAEALAAVPSGLVKFSTRGGATPLKLYPLDYPHMTTMLMPYRSLGGTS